MLGEFVGRPDSRQHQHLRRVDHAAGEQDFPVRAHLRRLSVPGEFEPRRPAVLNQETGDERAGLEGYVGAL